MALSLAAVRSAADAVAAATDKLLDTVLAHPTDLSEPSDQHHECGHVLHMVVRLLQPSADASEPEQAKAAFALATLSSFHENNDEMIQKAGGVKALVVLMESLTRIDFECMPSEEPTLLHVVLALRNLTERRSPQACTNVNDVIAADQGIVDGLTACLIHANLELGTAAAQLTERLTWHSREACRVLGTLNVVSELLRLVRGAVSGDGSWQDAVAAAGALRNLCTLADSSGSFHRRCLIDDEGGVEALVELVREARRGRLTSSEDGSGVAVVVGALSNLMVGCLTMASLERVRDVVGDVAALICAAPDSDQAAFAAQLLANVTRSIEECPQINAEGGRHATFHSAFAEDVIQADAIGALVSMLATSRSSASNWAADALHTFACVFELRMVERIFGAVVRDRLVRGLPTYVGPDLGDDLRDHAESNIGTATDGATLTRAIAEARALPAATLRSGSLDPAWADMLKEAETRLRELQAEEALDAQLEAHGLGSHPVPDEFVCPITHEPMADPVVASDGHSYEHHAIRKVMLEGNNRSPLTRDVLQPDVYPNWALKRRMHKHKSELLCAATAVAAAAAAAAAAIEPTEPTDCAQKRARHDPLLRYG